MFTLTEIGSIPLESGCWEKENKTQITNHLVKDKMRDESYELSLRSVTRVTLDIHTCAIRCIAS